MDEGRTAEACPKFLASYALDPRVGTVFNLAACYEKNKQIASAWARFVEARTLATRANQPERVAYAGEHAALLEPRRSSLSIVVDHPPPGLVVKRDDVVVDVAVYGAPVPVDGGAHTIEATAPGKIATRTTITVADESDAKTFAIAPLVDAPVASSMVVPPSPSARRRMSTRAIAGLGVAGVGVVALGVGAAFGALALSANHDSLRYCNVGGVKDDCFGAGVGLRSSAVTDATLSSVFLGVGAAAVVGGVVVWLTAPSARAPTTVGFDGRMLRVEGAF